MRKSRWTVLGVLVMAGCGFALPLRGGLPKAEGKSFVGEIMDDMCAKSGSHTEMQKMMKSMGTDAKTCTVECVKMGGKYVLYDSSSKTSYQLDPQEKAKDFAGQKVKVTGTSEGSTIHVKSIEPAS